jgi:hypothetical protein
MLFFYNTISATRNAFNCSQTYDSECNILYSNDINKYLFRVADKVL